jgi:endoglucanase
MKPQVLLRWLVLTLSLALASSVRAASSAPGGAYTFRHGVNISHWLSQCFDHPYGTPWFTEADVQWIAEQGFDHIRLPVDVRLCVAADGSLDPAKLKPISDCIGWSRKRGLGLVLDAHFLPGADFNNDEEGRDARVYTDLALQQKVAGIWRALAKHFAQEGPNVRFEILNEPVAEKNADLNPFMHHMLKAIRESNPTRVVYVTSNKWSGFWTVPDVVLPDDPNIALTIHTYDPMIFTHQRASWANFTDKLPPVKFPGTVPDYLPYLRNPKAEANLGKPGDTLDEKPIDERFQKVADWVAKTRPGLEVYVGEFGVYFPADAQSKINWIRTIVRNCDRHGWSWAVWDYNDSFGVRGKDGKGTPILTGLGLKPKK